MVLQKLLLVPKHNPLICPPKIQNVVLGAFAGMDAMLQNHCNAASMGENAVCSSLKPS